MKLINKRLFLLLTVLVTVSLNACGSSQPSEIVETVVETESDSETSSAVSDDDYEAIMAAENISVEDAYAKLKDASFGDSERQAFVQELGELVNCSGQFVQESENTGNKYNATVAFYLSSGTVNCAITYSGYMGTIADGTVEKTQESGYSFESFPKGDLYGNEQDFQIYFASDTLRIIWGDSCDYVLDRGEGSVDSVQDYETPFEQTDAYAALIETLDDTFSSYEHDYVYDENAGAFTLYVEAPEGSRIAIKSQQQKYVDGWETLTESVERVSGTVYDAINIVENLHYANIIWVDQLNSTNSYDEDDYLLWAQNGTIKYNYATIVWGKKTSDSTKSSTSNNNTATTSKSNTTTSGKTTEDATTGEIEALEKAFAYLDYSGFSYSGLIDQLEYEGFTSTEATYAVDHCGADWNVQAVRVAKSYLDYSSFSKSELLEQLEYEGFTNSQAQYAVNQVY